MVANTHLPKTVLKKMLKDEGAVIVTGSGLEAFRAEVERYAHALGEQSVLCSRHAHRKTLLREDVQLAVR